MKETLARYGIAAFFMLYIFGIFAAIGFFFKPIVGDTIALLAMLSWIGIGPLSLLFALEYFEKKTTQNLNS
jgi:hypothetical protein